MIVTIATIQIVVIGSKKNARGKIRKILKNTPEIVDWQYLPVGGEQYAMPVDIEVGSEYKRDSGYVFK